MSSKQVCPRLRIMGLLRLHLLRPLIKPRVYALLLGGKTRIGLEIGSSSPLL